MKEKNITDFAKAVTGYLTKYLPFQRNCSGNTVRSYAATLKLLVRFIKNEKRLDLDNFTLNDLTKPLVLEFIEKYRGNGAGIPSANQRLAAIKSFCSYCIEQSVDNMEGLQSIRTIRSPKQQSKSIGFLTIEQTQALVNCPDSRSPTGLRHRAILSLLYDSGARVQELCDIKVKDVSIDESTTSTVYLHGKGKKDRVVFISSECAKLLATYKDRFLSRSEPTDPFIINREGKKINQDGVSYIVKKYAAVLAKSDPTFPKRMHCHMLRHSKAMHLLQAGINIVYIRDFLGHESINTTMIYAKADNRTKAEVLEKLAPKIALKTEKTDWRKDGDLLEFLESLGRKK